MKTLSLLSTVGAVTAAGLLGYAVYFDYRRRNDPTFRKQLKQQKARIAKQKQVELKEKEARTVEYLKDALELVKNEIYPSSIEEKEKYFMENLQQGEVLFRQGAEKTAESAACFFKAVKVYPNPVDLLVILQKSVPEDVVNVVYAMISTEVHEDQGKYFQELTARYPGIEIQVVAGKHNKTGEETARRSMVVTKDYTKGDLIYMEEAVAASLHPSVFTINSHCHGCLQPLAEGVDPDATVSCPECVDVSVFCSTKCLQQATKEFHKVLCPQSKENPAARKLWNYCVENDRMYPFMVARFMTKMIWKQVVDEMERMSKGDKTSPAKVLEEWEHLEKLKLRDIDITEDERTEADLVRKALAFAAPGAQDFLNAERYATIKGSFMYNSYGLPSAKENISTSVEMTRCASAQPTSQYGAGLFFVTAYLNHDALANTSLSFVHRETKLPFVVVKAGRDIRKGEELTTSYVPAHDANAKKALAETWDIQVTTPEEEIAAQSLLKKSEDPLPPAEEDDADDESEVMRSR